MHIRKHTTNNPAPMPIRTASRRKNCSSRRLNRETDRMLRITFQWFQRVRGDGSCSWR